MRLITNLPCCSVDDEHACMPEDLFKLLQQLSQVYTTQTLLNRGLLRDGWAVVPRKAAATGKDAKLTG